MSQFNVGDTVTILENAPGAPAEWFGSLGTVLLALPTAEGIAHIDDPHQVEWEPCYVVRLEEHPQWVILRESWLSPA